MTSIFKTLSSKEDLLKAASEAGLAEHNRVRALHRDTPPMIQGLEQTISAQAYAEKLVNDWKGTLQHSANNDRPGQGENLAYNWEATPAAACKKATNQWYDEIKDYKYAKPGFAMNTGHFTQVLYETFHGTKKPEESADQNNFSNDCHFLVPNP